MDVRKIAHAIEAAPETILEGEEVVKPTKAYKNVAFLNGPAAKPIRVLSEMTETETRMAGSGINKTILFFGSARSKSPEEHDATTKKTQAIIADPNTAPGARAKAEVQLKRLAATRWMCDVYPSIEALARRLTQWSMARIGPDGRLPYAIATGGGPGLMEAANRGAASVPGAVTLGCGISLPFEVGLNKYVTPELAFEYHYFFVRKFSMCYWCRAFIVAPGGYGSMDELFEVLTLLQTGKIDLPDLMPVVLFGRDFWNKIINWQALVDLGTIAQSDVHRLFITDSVEDAFAHVTGKLLEWETAAAKAAAEATAAAIRDRSRLSAASQAYLRYTEGAAASAAASMGESLPSVMHIPTTASGAAPAHKASFHGPPPVTPGGTLDATPPTASEIGSPSPVIPADM